MADEPGALTCARMQDCLARVLNAAQAPVFCTLRTRKRCEVLRCAAAAAKPPVLLHACCPYWQKRPVTETQTGNPAAGLLPAWYSLLHVWGMQGWGGHLGAPRAE